MRPRTRAVASVHGFSLLELLVSVVIFGGVLWALMTTSLVGNQTVRSSEAYLQVQEAARRALHQIGREIRQTNGASLAISGAAGQQQLDFEMSLGYGPPNCPAATACWGAIDQDGTVLNPGALRYRLDTATNQLIREVCNTNPCAAASVQSMRVLANDVVSIDYVSTGAPVETVTVDLQVQQTNQALPGGSMSAAPAGNTLTTRIRLRNT